MTPAVGVDFLVTSPLLWLTLTLGAYLAATMVSRRFGKPPVLNPTLWSIVAIVLVLVATGTPYRRYFEGAQFVHFLLGPAVVALAVPLYRHAALIRRSTKAVAGGLVVGTFSAILSGVLVVRLLGSAICRLVRVKDWPARGFAMGLTSHGIATARAFQEHEIAGTFAALAMALNGVATALATPAVIGLLDSLG